MLCSFRCSVNREVLQQGRNYRNHRIWKVAWLKPAGNSVAASQQAAHVKIPVSSREKALPTRYDTDYEIGQDNIRTWGMDFHNPVFVISAVMVLLFVIGTLMFPGDAKQAFDGTKGWSINNFDWFFLVAGNIFVIFCLLLIVLPVGKIRLGGVKARPEFSTLSWFAMLFAAGMGIGLMYWSVAEPTAYYTNWWGTPLNVAERTPQGA